MIGKLYLEKREIYTIKNLKMEAAKPSETLVSYHTLVHGVTTH